MCRSFARMYEVYFPSIAWWSWTGRQVWVCHLSHSASFKLRSTLTHLWGGKIESDFAWRTDIFRPHHFAWQLNMSVIQVDPASSRRKDQRNLQANKVSFSVHIYINAMIEKHACHSWTSKSLVTCTHKCTYSTLGKRVQSLLAVLFTGSMPSLGKETVLYHSTCFMREGRRGRRGEHSGLYAWFTYKEMTLLLVYVLLHIGSGERNRCASSIPNIETHIFRRKVCQSQGTPWYHGTTRK